MSDSENIQLEEFNELEDQLRGDAVLLGQFDCQPVSADDIRQLSSEQRREGMMRSTLTLVACVLLAMIGRSLMLPAPESPTQVLQVEPSRNSVAPLSPRAVSPDLLRPAAIGNSLGSNAALPNWNPGFDQIPGNGAYPFEVVIPGPNGPVVIGTGVYVPPRVDQVDLQDLSPAQQSAVIRVLNIPESDTEQDPI